MQKLNLFHISEHFSYRLSLFIISFCFILPVASQTCPYNIDFEKGTFDGWQCYIGTFGVMGPPGGDPVITLTATPTTGPEPNRHTMYSLGDGFDGYGGFPVACPNGGRHSVKLGNDGSGAQAEGISCEFIIPAGQDKYTLVYDYAVVFEDPFHFASQQPRMEIEVTNVTDHHKIDCSSFIYYPNGSSLPGFKLSNSQPHGVPVWYKEWSTATINLDGLAGKRIRIFVKTADCAPGAHFGYGYIDFRSECNSTELAEISYCPDDAAVNIDGPYGYQYYTWYNSDFSQVLGTGQFLSLSPIPVGITTVAVIVKPYEGYGCVDTFYRKLQDNLVIVANAGNDTAACNGEAVQIGKPAEIGVIYNWTPTDGLSDPHIAQPLANPAFTTTYTLHTSSAGGGCRDEDEVTVRKSVLDNSIDLIGKQSFCLNSGDNALLVVHPTDNIQWYKDDVPIIGAIQSQYNVTETGTYHAILSNLDGCRLRTNLKRITISTIPEPGFVVPVKDQCLLGNNFTFTNTSTNLIGPMQYRWMFGDGAEASTRDVTHSYSKAGTYQVKLVVTSNTICSNTISTTIHVYPHATPEFDAAKICVDLPLQLINKTADTLNSPITYLWDLGNGQFSNNRNPPPLTYPNTGIYPVKLSVSTAQCPSPVMSKLQYILVDLPKKGIRYPTQVAVENLPLELHARQFGGSVSWTPPVSLSSSTTADPVFRGITEQLYTIELKTESGCLTVDTQMVKLIRQIGIYVPTAFTPDGDGVNDVLRPTMYGIKTLNYFRVFNRWGKLLFQTNVYNEGWDGSFRSVKQESQTYVWLLEAIGADGNKYVRKGTSILLR